MAKYVDSEVVKDKLSRTLCLHEDLPALIDSIPAVDVRPVVRGKWEQTKDEFGIYNKCSVCGKEYYCGPIAPFNFCPNCGAEMMEES